MIVYHLIAYGTIDEEVQKLLKRKEKLQNKLITAVKAVIDKTKRNG